MKHTSLSALPLIASAIVPANAFASEKAVPSKDSEAVYFINDGIFYRPEDFINKLQEINIANPIERDSYAEGATMEKLLKKFIEITGKETDGFVRIKVNPTLLRRDNQQVFEAFKDAIAFAGG